MVFGTRVNESLDLRAVVPSVTITLTRQEYVQKRAGILPALSNGNISSQQSPINNWILLPSILSRQPPILIW